MSKLYDFNQIAAGAATPQQRPFVADSAGPPQQVSRVFQHQSYFDSTLLQRALLLQSPNEPIVASTRKEEQVSGYAIGLHPSSQTPVAVEFRVGGHSSSSSPITLTPGQIVRPQGLPHGVKNGVFSSFVWGLPYGWLGGGMATLVVMRSPDATMDWRGQSEVVFHRQRMAISTIAGMPAAAPSNWPLRFPWPSAVRGTNSTNQRGEASIGVTPTRTLLRLRTTTLAAAADMRIVVQGSNDFDLDSAGAPVLTTVAAADITWGTWAAVGAGDLAVQYQVRDLPSELVRIAADGGGMSLVDLSGTLTGLYVDVVRYGVL